MNWMVLPNQVCLIVKLYNNRPGLLPDSNEAIDYVVVFICANIVNKLDFSGNIAYICRQICGRARSAVRQLRIPEIY